MIPYWNLLPLRHEIEKTDKTCLELNIAPPSLMNQWLLEGRVDLAPCSSLCLLQNADFEMALPLGVASDGPVKSVYLGLQREHLPLFEGVKERRENLARLFRKASLLYENDARAMVRFVMENLPSVPILGVSSSIVPGLVLSKASASSNALAKIFYSLWFGSDVCKIACNPQYAQSFRLTKPIELIIGDEALTRKSQFCKTLDLGFLWKELTGLPFVFAAWQSKGACLNGWRRKILEHAEKAEKRMHHDPLCYLPTLMPTDEAGKKIDLPDYWKNISYRLNAKELKGLVLFLCIVRQMQAIPFDTSLLVKISRWQELSQMKSPLASLNL